MYALTVDLIKEVRGADEGGDDDNDAAADDSVSAQDAVLKTMADLSEE